MFMILLACNPRCCCHHAPSCPGSRRHHQSDLSEVVVEDNCCYCNYAVIPTMFASGTFDVIYATYHVDVGETPFFVVVDYEKEAVVVSIRGTLSLKVKRKIRRDIIIITVVVNSRRLRLTRKMNVTISTKFVPFCNPILPLSWFNKHVKYYFFPYFPSLSANT